MSTQNSKLKIGNKFLIVITCLVVLLLAAAVLSSSRYFGLISNSTSEVQQKTTKETEKQQKLIIPKPVADYEQVIISTVEKVAPSVVSIIVTKDLSVIEQYYFDPFAELPEEFKQFFAPFFFPTPKFPGVPRERVEKRQIGGGSGFAIAEDLILTNKHVVEDEQADYTVVSNEGERYEAEILAKHPTLDLAVLKIKSKAFKPVNLGDSDKLRLGQTVIAIGNALGEFKNTVSRGVVSGLGRNIVASGGRGVERIMGVIQTDAAINRGNSGGPLINIYGEVVGINTAMAFGAENIGFAIPINQAKQLINSAKKNEKIVLPFLGVRYITITKEMAERENLPVDYGALIRGSEEGPAIFPGSAAEEAGLRPEDIIVEVDGVKLDKYWLGELILKHQVGDTISLKVVRKGKP